MSLNGQTYSSTVGENLIVLKQLPPMSKILIRMVEDFQAEEDPAANNTAELVKMLDMLKNVPSNEDFIKSLGSKMGKKLIENYEKDKKINIWDSNTFVKYMEEMSVILKQVSNWSVVSENVIYGKITACPLVKGDALNAANCTFIKGLYDEWITHAFGEQIERVHSMSKTIASGNDFCEIYVAFKL
ncbi:Uncharacterised protein [uncultured archaeon]|nr:Uncharacterised protein [uncultured archaeon]